MPSWTPALAVALAVWCLSCAYIWLSRRPRGEKHRGVMALADMRWREFSRLVRQAMQDQRGMQELPDSIESRGAPASDFLMLQDHQLRMISCKHGRAYRIGAVAVDELAANARLTGAQGSVLLTVGKVERDGITAAQRQNVEVIDERKLWPFLKPVVSEDVLTEVVESTRREAIRHTAIAALAILALGLVAEVGYHAWQGATVPPPGTTPELQETSPQAPKPAPAVADAAGQAAAMPVQVQVLEDLDNAELQRLQADLSRALTATKGLRSGVWMTRSTVAVDRSVNDETAWRLICGNVARFPQLYAIRIQLNPLPGSNDPVRWRQCKLP
jgi:hypothetical protein